ncbi:MAG: class I SAM-dependent methyltransferase [Acidobacteriota bacterium]|nr:class I SAM-dependent methyltransferase [Acidobacteriota bacterium]
MRRYHLFEIIDQSWCPRFLRDGATDYLQHVTRSANPYKPVIGRLLDALHRNGGQRVIDLCSGAGGPWPVIKREFGGELNSTIAVCLTDWYPNLDAFRQAQADGDGSIMFHPEPVDARAVPKQLNGFRTLFAGFHHFQSGDATMILRDAVANRQGIAVIEATERRPLAVLLMLSLPLIVLLVTPAIRPFRWSRLFWTYLIPLLPLAITFDGIVSCLRTYTPDELRAMTEEIAAEGYQWQIGQERAKGALIAMTYLIGYPSERTDK